VRVALIKPRERRISATEEFNSLTEFQIMFELIDKTDAWEERQKPISTATEFRYGDNGTIHHTGHIDIGVDENGVVQEVWFRCMNIPFKQFKARYSINPESSINAIIFEGSSQKRRNANGRKN
jgi:hypothetical protein